MDTLVKATIKIHENLVTVETLLTSSLICSILFVFPFFPIPDTLIDNATL